MSSRTLRNYILPLLNDPGTEHLSTIRLGTKSLAYWPYRFSSDPDSKSLLQLFSEIINSGKHVTIQAHFSHPRELEHPAAQNSMRLIKMTGAQIRCQGPLIRRINDDPSTWARMWDLQTRLGAVPYYMWVVICFPRITVSQMRRFPVWWHGEIDSVWQMLLTRSPYLTQVRGA